MDVLKGLGGAVVIASAAGCAANQPEPVTPVLQTPVILTQVEEAPAPVVVKPVPVPPEPVEFPEETIIPEYPDVHPACGRG